MTSAAQSMDHLALDMVLPWHEQAEQQEKFKKLLKKVIIPIMVFMTVMPLLPDLTGEEEVEEKVVTKVMLEPPVLEPTPPPPSEPKKQRTQDKRPDAQAKPGALNGVQSMQNMAQRMAEMRNSIQANRQQNKNVFTASSGKVQKSQRALLGNESITSTSGGIKASDVTVNAKGAALATHQSDSVSSSIADVVIPTAKEYNYDPSKSYRDKHSIRREIERYRGGAIYPIYTKALRLNPDLGGRFVFSFTIMPSGKVKNVKLVGSELNDPVLERKILAKMKLIDFGQENKAETPVEYTFSFVPS